ncbi:hypothetical protein Tco_0073118, partial [Tanacetum coccineum]
REEDDDVDNTKDDDNNDGMMMVMIMMIMMVMMMMIVIMDQSNEEHEEDEEEYVDEFSDKEDDADNANEENEEELDDAEELYKDVNVNLRKADEEEDAHVTLTAVHDTQKTEGPMQSSSVSSDFIEKLLNFENISPTKNEIASLMDTIVYHEEPSDQTSSLFTVLITVIPEITSTFTTTIPLQHPFFNPLPQQATLTPTPIASEVTTSFPALPDFASILPQAVSEFATLVIELNVTESLEATVLAKSSSQPKSTYEAAASLSEFELTKILMDKMEEQKSYFRADYKRELYDALVKSYNTEKDLFDTYGEVFTLKRSRDNKAKDQDPSARLDRGMKRRKSSKDVESSRDPKSNESKSTSSSKGNSRSQHKSLGKSAHAEEQSHTVDNSRVRHNQEFDMGNNDKQLDDDAISKSDWYKKPEQPLTPDPNWNKRQHVDFRPSQTWISNIARAEEPRTSFDDLMDTPIDFSAFVMNRLNITNLTQELLVGPAFNLLKGTCKSLTSLKIMKWYDYSHLDEIEVRKEDQQLYTFKEGDFPRLCLQEIDDILLLLVQQRLTNLTIDERYDLNVSLRMFTGCIVIQRRVEDLQLGVKSYQKKLNLTKPDTFRSDLRNRTAYTAYSDPQGVIYKDQNNRNRLIRTDELHKFSDGTLNYVRTTLHDITLGIRMEYLPKRKWSGLDK